MSDTIDRANAQAALILSAELASRKPAGPPFTGLCLHCEEPVPAPLRWCCADCRDQWQCRQERLA